MDDCFWDNLAKSLDSVAMRYAKDRHREAKIAKAKAVAATDVANLVADTIDKLRFDANKPTEPTGPDLVFDKAFFDMIKGVLDTIMFVMEGNKIADVDRRRLMTQGILLEELLDKRPDMKEIL